MFVLFKKIQNKSFLTNQAPQTVSRSHSQVQYLASDDVIHISTEPSVITVYPIPDPIQFNTGKFNESILGAATAAFLGFFVTFVTFTYSSVLLYLKLEESIMHVLFVLFVYIHTIHSVFSCLYFYRNPQHLNTAREFFTF